jgi:hypothetical protein
VIWSFVYLAVRELLALAVLISRFDRSKELEILVLRHELAILRRRSGRNQVVPADRALLAALSQLLPRRVWPTFSVKPETLLRWHRQLVARRWTYPHKRPAPMLFDKMAQLGRVATDLFAGTATLPDVDVAYVERLWPVLVTAGDLMQTEILWDRIDERMPDALRRGRVQPLTVLDIGDFELLLGLVAEGHGLPSILARKSAGPYRRLELSRLVVDELHMAPPLRTRPLVMNERWDALAQEMRAVFAFANKDQ